MNSKIILSALALAVAIAACEKNDTLRRRGEVMGGAGIKVMHMSPDAPVLNIFVDTSKALGNLPLTAGGETGIPFGTIVPSLSGGYALVGPGARTLSARVPTSSTERPGQVLVSTQTTLVEGKNYTVALVNFAAKMETVIVEDKLDIPDTSKSYFRIANFLPDAKANVEFTFSSGTNTGNRFTRDSIPFKAFTEFEPIAPETYKILLRANNSATRLDSITAFAPIRGRKYTLYTRGQIGGTTTKRPLIFQTTTL